MNSATESFAMQVFAPASDALFPIDTAAHLAGLPRHVVLVCCRRGMVTPFRDPNYGGFYFDLDAIRTLQRIQYLRTACGVNLTGIELILKLMAEVEELRALTRR